jgi:hypothetical protein
MEQGYKLANTQKVKIEELKNEKSKQIASSISAFGKTVKILEIAKEDGDREILFVQFLLDIPNNPINDIRQKETIKIVTFQNSSLLPQVFAMREDFPLELPHTNFGKEVRPVSLCIFEESFEELKHRWSASLFIQSIKNWLELTSIDALHQEDQFLEPFLIGDGFLIFDSNHQYVEKLSGSIYRTTENYCSQSFHLCGLNLNPFNNGVIHRSPDNLFEFAELFKNQDIDILELIRPEIYKIAQRGIAEKRLGDFWSRIVILVLIIPIKRDASNTEPSFVCLKINCSLGDLLRIFGFTIVNLNAIFKTEDNLKKETLKNIGIETLNLMPHLNIEKARSFSNSNTSEAQSKISLVGLGALGSQFFMNLSRNGFGIWNLIDKDIMLPHNFIRHASTNVENHMALNKAKAISHQANDLLDDPEFSKALDASIYDIDITVLLDSDIIIDMSTSIGVERYLANEIKGVRKFSSFLNPVGTDLVMLSEDNLGHYPLDILEIQYYKELLKNPKLSNHLTFEQEGRIRYARGCRDITSKIPQENLSIFSGIAAKAFKKKIIDNEANIDIWRIENEFTVTKNSFKIDDWNEETVDGWTIFINKSCLLDVISSFRISKLPNETGGILIGTIDSFYRKIYIIDTILSPEDSIERPTLFIRGIKGVSQKLKEIYEITNDNLKYLGEWHSHPKNCGLGMSGDDKIQFAELKNEAKLNGQPAIMLILGDDDKFEVYLGNCE